MSVSRHSPYTTIAVIFVSLLLISNVAATKLVAFNVGSAQLILDGGAVLFPFTYVLGDVLAEVYGFARTRRIIFMGFFASVLAALVFLLVQVLPSPTEYVHQDAYEAILGFVPRIVLASLAGYLIGQLLNAYVLVWIKKRWGENNLWVRLLGSSAVGEAADTLVFCTVAFYGVLVGAHFWNYVLIGYLYKMLFEVALVPLSYLVIRKVKGAQEAADSTKGGQRG